MRKVRKITLHKTSQKGLREFNEDVEKYSININIKDGTSKDIQYSNVDFFLVCDGHGGSEVAKFIAPLLEKTFMNINNVYPLKEKYVIDQYNIIQENIKKYSMEIAERCGSTAIVVVRYLDEDYNECLQIINLGDCRAVLSRGGIAIPLSADHKPIWPNERRRIEKINKIHNLNEKITFCEGDWRIGDLSVSRSFGDLDNKPYVSNTPEIYNCKMEKTDEFVIVACDGLWDVMQNHEVINFIKDHVNGDTEMYNMHNICSPDENNIATRLALYAIYLGSTDNVSVLIIFFNKK